MWTTRLLHYDGEPGKAVYHLSHIKNTIVAGADGSNARLAHSI